MRKYRSDHTPLDSIQTEFIVFTDVFKKGCPRVNASSRDTPLEDDSEIEVTKGKIFFSIFIIIIVHHQKRQIIFPIFVDSYLTSKNRLDKTINNAERKMEFWRFKGSLQNFLDKLEINFCMYKSGKLDKTECKSTQFVHVGANLFFQKLEKRFSVGEILIKSRIQLSSLITRLIDGLHESK